MNNTTHTRGRLNATATRYGVAAFAALALTIGVNPTPSHAQTSPVAGSPAADTAGGAQVVPTAKKGGKKNKEIKVKKCNGICVIVIK